MAYSATLIADSVSITGHRLTTFQITIPKWILAELNTHRMLSRNAASSRAIPIEKVIEQVKNDPVIPIAWGRNQRGMQAKEVLTDRESALALESWLEARDKAIGQANYMSIVCCVHKQIANRLLEPWMWATVIVSATEYDNFFRLRCHPDAQPELQHVAFMMRDLYLKSTPTLVTNGQYHLPYVTGQISTSEDIIRSVARCARVSYSNHGKDSAFEDDQRLYNQLAESGHLSPFEHVATPADGRHGNFEGWQQVRQTLEQYVNHVHHS
jgi:thymidylate synthase ThyX